MAVNGPPQGRASRHEVRGVCCRSLLGVCLYMGALIMVAWSEKATACYLKALQAAHADVVSVECDGRRELGDEKRPIHLSCPIARESLPTWTPQSLGADWLSGAFSVEAVRVKQVVAMYQCEETKHTRTIKEGESEKAVDSWKYELVWSATHLPSDSFKGWKNKEALQAMRAGCGDGFEENPSFPISSTELAAPSLIAGGRDLSRHLGELKAEAPLKLRPSSWRLPQELQVEKRVARDGKAYTYGEFLRYYGDERGRGEWRHAEPKPATASVKEGAVHTCDDQAVGCLSIRFFHSSASHVSLLAAGGPARTTEPWVAPSSWWCSRTKVDLFAAGQKSASALVHDAESSSSLAAWGVRALGMCLAVAGVHSFLRPLQAMADLVDRFLDWFRFVPLLGGILDLGGDLIAEGTDCAIVLVSLSLGIGSVLAVLCVAWSVMLGAPLLVLAAFVFASAYRWLHKRPKRA